MSLSALKGSRKNWTVFFNILALSLSSRGVVPIKKTIFLADISVYGMGGGGVAKPLSTRKIEVFGVG